MIEMSVNKTGEITILDPIGESDLWTKKYGYREFVADLDGQWGEIKVNIGTLGGSAKEALSIYDHLRTISAPVITRIVSDTASAGTIISLAGDRREIHPNSNYFIHRAQLHLAGNSDQIREASEIGDLYDQKVLKLYAERTGRDPLDIWELMQREEWLTAEQALEWGFVTHIINEKKESDMKNTKKQEVAMEAPDEKEAFDKMVKNAPMPEDKEEKLEEVPEEPKAEEAPEEVKTEEGTEEDEMDPTEMKQIIDALKSEVKNLKAKLEEKEIDEAEMRATRIAEIVNDAHERGVISETESWMEIGLNTSEDKLKTLLLSITDSERLSEKINFQKPQAHSRDEVMNLWKEGKINRGELEKRLKSVI